MTPCWVSHDEYFTMAFNFNVLIKDLILAWPPVYMIYVWIKPKRVVCNKMDTNPHPKIYLKNVFQNINYYLLIPRAISEAPKSKKDERIRIWGKSYGRANVHRCVKKCTWQPIIQSFHYEEWWKLFNICAIITRRNLDTGIYNVLGCFYQQLWKYFMSMTKITTFLKKWICNVDKNYALSSFNWSKVDLYQWRTI